MLAQLSYDPLGSPAQEKQSMALIRSISYQRKEALRLNEISEMRRSEE